MDEETIEALNIPGIFPLLNTDITDNFNHETMIHKYLELRSGFKFDIESVRYMIEECRQSPIPETIYQYVVRTGLIHRMRTKSKHAY